jgi:hypothetical protein
MRGKIARLPREIREELNQRLDNGELGSTIVDWLNSLTKTQQIVAAHFQGNVVTEQNLSEWRQGGFQEWLAREEMAEQGNELRAEAMKLGAEGTRTIADSLGATMAARYAALLSNWNGRMDGEFEQKARALRALCHDISKLRHGDTSSMRVAMDLERFRVTRNDEVGRAAEMLAAAVRGSKEGEKAFKVITELLDRRRAKAGKATKNPS